MKNRKSAQLTSALLASKGAAAPSHSSRESLGPDKVRQAILDAIAEQNRESEARERATASGTPPEPAAPPPAKESRGGGRVNLSVRIDPERHRRLKLAAIHLNESAQSIMIMALDSYLDRISGQIAALDRSFVDGDAAAGSEDDW